MCITSVWILMTMSYPDHSTYTCCHAQLSLFIYIYLSYCFAIPQSLESEKQDSCQQLDKLREDLSSKGDMVEQLQGQLEEATHREHVRSAPSQHHASNHAVSSGIPLPGTTHSPPICMQRPRLKT